MNEASSRLSGDRVAGMQLFQDLSATDREAIAAHCRLRRFQAGEHVLHHHDTSSELFFVLEGRVRVLLYSPAGRDVSFRDLTAGEVFGELAAIDGGPRSASVVATEATSLAVMPAADFIALTESHTSVAQALLSHLVALIRRYSQRVYELSTLGVEQRVRMQILRLAQEASEDGASAVLKPAPSLADLASLVSTTREAVSREISRLGREGLVERRGNTLRVLDIDALGDSVEGDLA